MIMMSKITAAIPSIGIFPLLNSKKTSSSSSRFFGASPDVFPPFLLKEMEKIQDPFARKLVSRIEMLPVEDQSWSSKLYRWYAPAYCDPCSCLEWRYTLPLLEQAGLEAWAVDILGWGFNNLG
ncbi:hypothetical protein Tco_1419395 [Tanacetum coccineum]